MTRPSWDAYFLSIADVVASRADCTRRKVGGVLVKDRRIVATGYNGAPPGEPGCLTDGACPRGRLSFDQMPSYQQGNNDYSNCIAIHDADNALRHAPEGAAVGATFYGTHPPCANCERLLQEAGVVRVVTYTDPMNLSFCKVCSKRFTYDGDETRLYCDDHMDDREGAVHQEFTGKVAQEFRSRAVPGVYSEEQTEQMRGWHGL